MYKLLISILTFAFTSLMTVMSAPTTCNNPLLSTFGFTPLSAPQKVANLVYCKSLINSQSCCSDTIINNFQVQANELTGRLTRIVIARDQFLITMRTKVVNQLQTSLNRLRSASDKAMRVIKASSSSSSNSTNSTNGNNSTNSTNSTKPANSTSGSGGKRFLAANGSNSTNGTNSTQNGANSTNSTQSGGNNSTQNGTNSTNSTKPANSTKPGNSTNPTNSTTNSTNSTTGGGKGNGKFDQITIDFVQRFGDLARSMTTELPQLKGNLANYQKSRANCIMELINIQASAWCLACDPNWGNKGVAADGSIQLSRSLCSRLTSICYDFVQGSDEQNSILTVNYISPMFDALASAMEKIARGDPSGPSALNLAYNSGSESSTAPRSNAQLPASKPETCTSGKCDFICSSFLVKGAIDEDTLAAGGELASSSSGSSSSSNKRVLEEEAFVEGRAVESLLKKRKLQGEEGWNPDQDESGIAVAFEEDPGQVNKSSSNLIYNAVVCISALLVALLI